MGKQWRFRRCGRRIFLVEQYMVLISDNAEDVLICCG
jgi:hypothetical protein